MSAFSISRWGELSNSTSISFPSWKHTPVGTFFHFWSVKSFFFETSSQSRQIPDCFVPIKEMDISTNTKQSGSWGTYTRLHLLVLRCIRQLITTSYQVEEQIYKLQYWDFVSCPHTNPIPERAGHSEVQRCSFPLRNDVTLSSQSVIKGVVESLEVSFFSSWRRSETCWGISKSSRHDSTAP